MTVDLYNGTASLAPEAIYIRDGFVRGSDGSIKPIFLAHADRACDFCEWPLGSKLKHPQSSEHSGCVVGCDGSLLKLEGTKRLQ